MASPKQAMVVLGALACIGLVAFATLRDAEAVAADPSAPQGVAASHPGAGVADVPRLARNPGHQLKQDTTSGPAAVVPVPQRLLPETGRIEAPQWKELIATLPADQAAYLESVNARYFGALAYDSPQMLKEMVALGFPTPDEWLRAREMTDQDLATLADRGNRKAQAFQLDRVLAQTAEYATLRDKDPDAYAKSMGPRLAMRANELAPRIQASDKSAFAAYLLGHTYAALSQPASPESAAAGMFLAVERGDRRAVNLLQRYQAKHPGMNIGVVMAAYSSFR